MSLEKLELASTKDNALCELLDSPEEFFVGSIVGMNYESVSILTNDFHRERVGGIPMNCFLLATAFNPLMFHASKDIEQFVLLLRVTGSARLPQDQRRLESLIEHHQRQTSVLRTEENDGIEQITLGQLQFSGLECNILGAFYINHSGHLELGADIEDFQAFSQMRVFKPSPKTLESIVNFIPQLRKDAAREEAEKAGLIGEPETINIGSVRFSSTRKLHNQHKYNSSQVRIQPLDFLSRRTGVFGMTRTGKSNTIKTTIAAVNRSACKNKIPVGQIIFDMNGEYANANGQDDGSSIAEVFSDNTVRYRGIETPGFLDFRDNFYQSLENGLATIQSLLELQSSIGEDMLGLKNLSLVKPDEDDSGGMSRWFVTKSIYQTLLYAGGFPFNSSDNFIKFKVGEKVLAQIYKHAIEDDDDAEIKPKNEKDRALRVKELYGDPGTGLSLEEARKFFSLVRSANLKLRASNEANTGIQTASKNEWLSSEDNNMLNLIVAKKANGSDIRGASFIYTLSKDHHARNGSDHVARDIFNHLAKGRTVILDLSVGQPSIRESRSKQIAQYIFNSCQELFSKNPTNPPKIVLYIEEAHNLISAKARPDEIWPRIAKEGAKYGISLVYATQEPSSISSNVLANTENMFVTHLNNDDELRTLSKYYDFADFVPSLKKAQDVGFARIKTLSIPFVVPTQIHRFNPSELIEEYKSLPRHPDFVPYTPPS